MGRHSIAYIEQKQRSSAARHGAYVGRVGVLAVALGIGTALAPCRRPNGRGTRCTPPHGRRFRLFSGGAGAPYLHIVSVSRRSPDGWTVNP